MSLTSIKKGEVQGHILGEHKLKHCNVKIKILIYYHSLLSYTGVHDKCIEVFTLHFRSLSVAIMNSLIGTYGSVHLADNT